MNVLFISNDPAIFNPESSVRARMRAYAKEIGTLHILSRAGKATHLIEREELGDGKALILHAVHSPKSKILLPISFISMLSTAKKIVRKEGIEIVSAQDPFEYGWIAMKAVQGTNAKLHIQIHTDPFSLWFTRVKILHSSQVRMPLINYVRQRIADVVIPKAAAIRVVSKRVQDSIAARYGSKIPVKVIPVAVSPQVPQAVPLPVHPFTFALITVGRLEPEKRIEDILMALARVHLKYPSVGLFVLGEGRERKLLEAHARKLGLTDSVQFLGQTDSAWGMMQNAQAYIQASGYEGYSRTLLEAALARIPIITTDVGIVGEVFKGYEDVLSAPPGDSSALATHIIGLVEDNEARKQFVLNAEHAAEEHLTSVHTTPADIAENLREMLI